MRGCNARDGRLASSAAEDGLPRTKRWGLEGRGGGPDIGSYLYWLPGAAEELLDGVRLTVRDHAYKGPFRIETVVERWAETSRIMNDD